MAGRWAAVDFGRAGGVSWAWRFRSKREARAYCAGMNGMGIGGYRVRRWSRRWLKAD